MITPCLSNVRVEMGTAISDPSEEDCTAGDHGAVTAVSRLML